MPKMPSQRGFSLLEAVVAIVLVSSAGLALFSWINGNLISLERVRETNARSEATQNALEYLAAVNPMLTPQGKASLGGVDIAWEARLTGPVRDRGLWQFALYDTDILLAREDGSSWFSFQLRQIGYKRVRSIQF